MKLSMKMTLTEDFSKQLKTLETVVQEKVLRSSARAGALVFYELMHAYAPYKEGGLMNAIYHKFINETSTQNYKSYRIGVNHKKAPHWHLLEYGHMMYYQVRKKPNGDWVTLVRKDKIGTPPPSRWASKEVKDAYYIPLKGGAKHIAGKAFIRKSYDDGKDMAMAAVSERAKQRFAEAMANPNLVDTNVD